MHYRCVLHSDNALSYIQLEGFARALFTYNLWTMLFVALRSFMVRYAINLYTFVAKRTLAAVAT